MKIKTNSGYPNGRAAGKEVTIEQLRAAFDKAAGKDWRSPIDTVVSCSYVNCEFNEMILIREAIEFFTGTKATSTFIDYGLACDALFHFEAIGYRNGPCGP